MLRFTWLASLLAAGCYAPDVDPCTLICSADRACPGELTCNPQRMCTAEMADVCTGVLPDAITVRSLDISASPQAGIAVVFTDAEGAQVAELTTDSDGLASAYLPPGGAVTTIEPRNTAPQSYDITTFIDPPAGVVLDVQGTHDPETRTISVTFTTRNVAVEHVLLSTCGAPAMPFDGGGGSRSGFIVVPDGCSPDVFVRVGDALSTAADPIAVAPAVTGPTLDVREPAWRAPVVTTLVPVVADALLNLNLDLEVEAIPWVTKAVAQGDPLVSRTIRGNALPQTWPIPAEVNVTSRVTFTLPLGGPQVVTERLDGLGRNYTVDLGPRTLPPVLMSGIDPASREIGWAQSVPAETPVTTPTLAVGEMTFSRTLANGVHAVRWRLIAPGSAFGAAGTDGNYTLPVPDLAGDREYEFDVNTSFESVVMTLYGFDPTLIDEVRARLGRPANAVNLFEIDALLWFTTTRSR